MKPQHHLDDSTLISYSAGALSEALGIVASTHLERCVECRGQLRDAERIGGALLLQQRVDAQPPAQSRAAILALIEREPEMSRMPAPTHHAQQDDPDRLPSALQPWFGGSIRALRWRSVAPGVQRIRAGATGGGNLMLLRVAPGNRLPLHSHGGNELTMILDGAYDDELGHFGPGDVADLDGQTTHQPVTAPGVPCICVAATDAPLQFSGWFARTLQPLLGF